MYIQRHKSTHAKGLQGHLLEVYGGSSSYWQLGTWGETQQSWNPGELLYKTSKNPSVVQALFGEYIFIYAQIHICIKIPDNYNLWSQ